MENKDSNTIDITKYLPHREPLLMVDFVTEISENEVKTIFDIREENILVQEGFFTEAGLIENIAQTCACIFGQTFFDQNKHESVKLIGFITSLKKIKIHSLPEVGTQILSDALMISKFENICNMHCNTFVKGQLIAEADINLFIKETNS